MAVTPSNFQAQQAARDGMVVQTVNVNMPSGSNGADIMESINNYLRRTGAGAIPITDTSRL